MLSKAKHFFLFVIIFNLFSSCANEKKQNTVSAETIINKDTSAVINSDIQNDSVWIFEFKKLRQALYQNDLPVIKSFFEFPLTTEQADGLLAVINYNTNKDFRKATNLQSEEEFTKYYKQIFRADFVKGLLPLKSDSLLQNNYASSTSWKAKNGDAQYSTTVSYDASDKTVSISLDAAYGIEADGNEENKTESTAILIFKINKQNKLKFNRVIMAG
jgi:hypothetical protein